MDDTLKPEDKNTAGRNGETADTNEDTVGKKVDSDTMDNDEDTVGKKDDSDTMDNNEDPVFSLQDTVHASLPSAVAYQH